MSQFKNEFVTVELTNDSTAIVLTWKGFIPSQKYKEGLDKALDIAKKSNIANWISDIRQMKVVGGKDQEWAATEWAPKAVKAQCYKKQAVIMPADTFGQTSAKNMISTVTVSNQQVEIQNFSSLEDAKKWLL